MWVENLSAQAPVICIAVSREYQLQSEVEKVNRTLSKRSNFNVIISLAGLEMLTSGGLSCLLMLHNSLSENGRLLILCKVGLPIKCVFRTTGLSSVFNFADDILAAQTMIRQAKHSEFQKTTH